MDIRTQNLTKPIDVARYLFTRLHQLGVRSVHGVPGDYNLAALDYIPEAGLHWVGNTNELNATYAADGYARATGLGAVVTTFGVGELSALNGIAGAYSEMVPVVHIVGCPSTVSQRDGMLLHHTLGNGDFSVFAKMSESISCVTERLNNSSIIASQIDHALRECYLQSRPVYLLLPTDMVTEQVDGSYLDTPIDLTEVTNNAETESCVVSQVLDMLHQASRPIVLIDACAVRHRVVKEVVALLEKTQLPAFVTPMGKGALDETAEYYCGVYAGDGSVPAVREAVEGADLVITVGSLKSDFNTTGFSYRLSSLRTVDLHSTWCCVGWAEYRGVKMRGVLQALTKQLEPPRLSVAKPSLPTSTSTSPGPNGYEEGTITHSYFWPRIGAFLREGDVVVTETGTANFGIWETAFPKGVLGLNQTLWGSIGWAVPAAQGAALGVRDANPTGERSARRRTVLFEGDGSLQLTVQEISTMIREGLDVVIFVIVNNGYTIERLIHGATASYNDIQQWRNGDLLRTFGGLPEATTRAFVARTVDELEALLKEPKFCGSEGAGGKDGKKGIVRLVEVYMPQDDAPRSLKMVAKRAEATNTKK